MQAYLGPAASDKVSSRHVALAGLLQQAGVRISMDGRGRWMDNVFIERLWRSLKYECVHLHAFETGSELRAGLSKWIGYYNTRRPHSGLDGRTPDEAYEVDVVTRLAAKLCSLQPLTLIPCQGPWCLRGK